MNKKKDSDKKTITIKIRISQKEATRLNARASQWTGGNVSKLVRHAISNMSVRPK